MPEKGLGGTIDASAYDSGGDRPVLLLLHGFGGTWHIWKPVIKHLESRRRVIALTLPGHFGGPDCPTSGDACVAGIADQLIGLMRDRGIESADVAGNSLGGWLALELARRGFARSVTALSPAGGWRTPKDYRDIARPFAIAYTLMPLIFLITFWLMGFAWIRQLLGKQTMEHGSRMTRDEFRASLRALKNTRIFRAMLRTMGVDGPIAPFTPKVPVRIAWGGRDQVIPFERYGRPLLDAVPGAELRTIDGVGHVPMYDDPEQVARQILEVCDRPEPLRLQPALGQSP